MCGMKGLLQKTFNNLPVDDVPKSGQMVHTAVLVIQVVSVLPNVYTQQGIVPVA